MMVVVMRVRMVNVLAETHSLIFDAFLFVCLLLLLLFCSFVCFAWLLGYGLFVLRWVGWLVGQSIGWLILFCLVWLGLFVCLLVCLSVCLFACVSAYDSRGGSDGNECG